MSYKVCHISATPDSNGSGINWGDKALVYATQKRFEGSLGKIDWTNMGCRKIYTMEDVDEINKHEFVIVGGGGLILPDTFENSVSGWQWGISSELIKKIKIPIIVYSIGWNLFPGQVNNDGWLRQNLQTLSVAAAFISLRHSEDVELFNDYTKTDKAVMNFCPSICIDEFKSSDSKMVGINIAGDRLEMRYHNIDKVVKNIRHFMYALRETGYEPLIINHQRSDFQMGRMISNNCHFRQIDLSTRSAMEGVRFYRSLGYMFATRGHAQMIPFGLGVKTASLISHPKLSRFLGDVSAMDTAIDINDPELGLKCMDMMHKLDGYNFAVQRHMVESDLIVNMEIIIRELKLRGVK